MRARATVLGLEPVPGGFFQLIPYPSHRVVSHRVVSHRVVSHRVVSHRVVSHRVVSHWVVSHRVVSHRLPELELCSPSVTNSQRIF